MSDEITPTTSPVEPADLVTSDEVLVSSVEEPTQEASKEILPVQEATTEPELEQVVNSSALPQVEESIAPAIESVVTDTTPQITAPQVDSSTQPPPGNTVQNPAPVESPTVSPTPETIPEPQPQSTTLPLKPTDLQGQKEPVSNGTSIKEVTYGIFNIPRSILMQMLEKANIAKEKRRRKKLEKIFTLFEKHKEITNDMVEKLLHVSDRTATNYLNILLKEGKIQRISKGGGTKYIKL